VDHAILFTYGHAAPGRETMALQVFQDGLAFFGKYAAEGKCGEPIDFMGPSGLNLILVPGMYEDLTFLTHLEEFHEIIMRAAFAVPSLVYQIGTFGEGVQANMARWARVGGELALM
jgi:hypothetical protein